MYFCTQGFPKTLAFFLQFFFSVPCVVSLFSNTTCEAPYKPRKSHKSIGVAQIFHVRYYGHGKVYCIHVSTQALRDYWKSNIINWQIFI